MNKNRDAPLLMIKRMEEIMEYVEQLFDKFPTHTIKSIVLTKSANNRDMKLE